MTQDKAYFIGINKDSFRRGIPAEVIGLKFCTPDFLEPRLCYHIQYSDGFMDYHPISDNVNFKIVSFTDIVNGNLPKLEF